MFGPMPLRSRLPRAVGHGVHALPEPGILQLSLIEFTWKHTTLGALREGDRVHVEADMLGKYVRQLAAPYLSAR